MTIKQEIIKETKGKILKCFNCGMCTGGCPIGRISNYNPRKIIRKILLNIDITDDIWICSSCFTCTARCPNGIDVAGIIDSLKIKAFQNKEKHPSITFNKAFLNSVEKYGRLYEVGFLAEFNMKSPSIKRSFRDMSLVPHLILKNKLSFFPHKIKNTDKVKKIFEKVREVEEKE